MFFKKNVRVVIKNRNLAIETKTGVNLYQLLIDEGVISHFLCKGNGQCGKCKVHITQKNINKPTKTEIRALARINLDAGYRLACQTIVKQDLVVDTSETVLSSIPSASAPLKTLTEENIPQHNISEGELLAETVDINEDTAALQHHTEAKTPPKVAITKTQTIGDTFTPLDGLLMVHIDNSITYYLYAASIDGIATRGTFELDTDLVSFLETGMMDYIHNVLRISDIDRIIILSDEPINNLPDNSDTLLDAVSYTNVDIGSMPCEIIRPLRSTGELSLFLRLLSVKGKGKLFIPLDKLGHIYYFTDNAVVRIPDLVGNVTQNIFNLLPDGDNPIVEISEDFRNIKTLQEFRPPNSITLPLLFRVASLMVKNKVVDKDLRIHKRNQLESSVPLEYVVKVVQDGDDSAFYLYRGKDLSLQVTQGLMSSLHNTRLLIHESIRHTEDKLGVIDTVILSAPTQQEHLLDTITDVTLIPKHLSDMTVHTHGDSAVIAVKFFQESNIAAYIQKNFGSYIKD